MLEPCRLSDVVGLPTVSGDERSSVFARPSPIDLVLIVVAITGISTSAIFIRKAAAPSFAISFWRNALASLVLVPIAFARPSGRRELTTAGRGALRLSALSGLFLGIHFAVWIPSLSFTSIASSTALVATQPIWAALIARTRGQHVPRLAAIGIAVAVSGAFVVTGGDLRVSGRAFGGDVLAVLGGITAAAYVTTGAEARRTLSANVHTAICFTSSAAALLVIALVARTPLVGYSSTTWGWIVALTLGAQLLGHAVFNIVLKTTSATIVSVSILFEIVGASLLAWAWFGERPPLRFLPAAALVGAGAVLVVRAGRSRAPVN